jgi:mono/diheme cytochrome c family protein
MSKRPFVIFGIWAFICVIVVPAWAIIKVGSGESSPVESVPSSDQTGLKLFQTNCGACHTLAAAGTDGVIGPNLDQDLGTGAKSASTVKAIEHLVFTTIRDGRAGRMPKGIVQGAQAKTVARFVADNLQYIGP